ncbi:Tetracycline repressor protein class A from transposon 1721 [Marinomonas spartinae]|uniref:TetR/AcrR family transcriptional regulator n=1 Tax=Marinomonas spartinae TaxID=1792290 RepID=UPI000808D9BA|nr:TetR/AcrR family transcriptional regulator [Marinomonas spartinae]SBS38619.1 Tetracycline repressor protein class A from transposon 1721 [Marinomonas spartinae]
MTTTKKTYHHGDLKITLIQAASDLLHKEGANALSMRKLADIVGVSRTAPYHHFKDKNALLCAIAANGFEQQTERLRQLINQQDHSEETFKKYVFLYIHFAQQQSELYDLMYGRTLWQTGIPNDSLKIASRQAFKCWIDWVEALQKNGVLTSSNTPLRVGQATWASLHGLARFLIDGIYIDEENVTEMAEQMLEMMILKHSLV